MTSPERVLSACRFERPDRIPRFDHFWSRPPEEVREIGGPDALTDIRIRVPVEGPFPSRMRTVSRSARDHVYVDQWGATVRTRAGAEMYETLEVAIPPGTDPDAVAFEPAGQDARYAFGHLAPADAASFIATERERLCVFGKTGGPYLRTCFVRGTEQFLCDMAADPPLARDLAGRMADHLAAVGVEEIRRWGLERTGIWIYDDMAHNGGPMFSAAAFERILLPGYRRMISAFRQAGARYVFVHSDGDIRPLLDMLVDAGIDGINPLEPRAGMDAVAIRKRYPRLILVGGMDNTGAFIHGPVCRIEDEARRLIDLGRDGGLVIGTHSISPETPFEHVRAYHRFCRSYGDFLPT